MFSATSVLAALAALTPTILAQDNSSYRDYNTWPNPDLYPQTLAHVPYSFPSCTSGPLSNTLACDTSASAHDRAATLVSLMTLEELISSTGNVIPAIPRLGLPNYNVWSEALHGLDRANFTAEGDYSWATSFPSPILTMAALNRTLINQIGGIISTQGPSFQQRRQIWAERLRAPTLMPSATQSGAVARKLLRRRLLSVLSICVRIHHGYARRRGPGAPQSGGNCQALCRLRH